MKLSEPDRTFQDLSKKEREYVIKSFVERIGAPGVFGGEPRKVVPIEQLIEALSVADWPDPITSPVELAWLSQPLDNVNFQGLKGYSIFWQRTDHAFEMWIRRRPERPRGINSVLANDKLLMEVLNVYRFYLSEETRTEHSKLMVKWRFKRVALIVVPHLLMLALFAVLLFDAQGISPGAYYLPAYIGGAALSQYAAKKFGRMSFVVIFAALLLLFMLYLQFFSEDLPPLSILDILIIGPCLLIGFFASELRDPYTIGDVLNLSGWARLRRLYEGSIKTTSIVTVFTYGVFRLTEYAIINIGWDSSLMLLLLMPMAIVATAEFVRREIERR